MVTQGYETTLTTYREDVLLESTKGCRVLRTAGAERTVPQTHMH